MVSSHQFAGQGVEERTPSPSGNNGLQEPVTEAVIPTGVFGRLISAIGAKLPVGYEDEVGFHYGTPKSC